MEARFYSCWLGARTAANVAKIWAMVWLHGENASPHFFFPSRWVYVIFWVVRLIKLFRTSDSVYISYLCHTHICVYIYIYATHVTPKHVWSFHKPKWERSKQSVKTIFYQWTGTVSVNWWDNQSWRQTFPRQPLLPPSPYKRLYRM